MNFDLYLYLYLANDRHLGSTATDFTVELPRSLNLEGEWECALLELATKNLKSDVLYVCTDVCG